MTSNVEPGVELGPVSLTLLGADSAVQRSKATTPLWTSQTAALDLIRLPARGESCNRRNWLASLISRLLCVPG
jgi:hypothetical protein